MYTMYSEVLLTILPFVLPIEARYQYKNSSQSYVRNKFVPHGVNQRQACKCMYSSPSWIRIPLLLIHI